MADQLERSGFDPAETQWQRQTKLRQQFVNRGSRYPPFSIEPLHHERERLEKVMTPEQRALRKEWVKAQKLSPNEPRYVPEYRQLNIFRRIYKKPLDSLESALSGAIGAKTAFWLRWCIPKGLLIAGGLTWVYYACKYHPNDWTRTGGARIYKEKAFQDKTEMKNSDYADRGFKSRKVLLNGETSSRRQPDPSS